MEATLLYSLISLGVGFAIRHFLPSASPTPPTFPTSIGHGELLKYLAQLLANAKVVPPEVPVPVPSPTVPPVAWERILLELIALLKAQATPKP